MKIEIELSDTEDENIRVAISHLAERNHPATRDYQAAATLQKIRTAYRIATDKAGA